MDFISTLFQRITILYIAISQLLQHNQFPPLEHQHEQFQLGSAFGTEHLFIRRITHQLFRSFPLQLKDIRVESVTAGIFHFYNIIVNDIRLLQHVRHHIKVGIAFDIHLSFYEPTNGALSFQFARKETGDGLPLINQLL